jgi:hypothetical protein
MKRIIYGYLYVKYVDNYNLIDSVQFKYESNFGLVLVVFNKLNKHASNTKIMRNCQL